jgi:toxin ParE1/3/4
MDGRGIERTRVEAGCRVTVWIVLPSFAACRDFSNIIRWTADRFGQVQARKYGRLITETINRLKQGPNIPNVRKRNDLMTGLRSLRLHNGRHVLFFEVDEKRKNTIVLIRILYDSMDFARHLPEEK